MYEDILRRFFAANRDRAAHMGARFDADESAFFARQLENVLSETFDVEYPLYMHRQFVPVRNEANPGAKTVTYRQGDRVGRAKFITDWASDLPRAEVKGAEFTRPVREMGIAYGWNLKEMLSARMANTPLDRDRANASREATEELLDNVACFGSPTVGIVSGFLNDTNVTITAATGVWSTLPPDQSIADVNGALGRIFSNTLQRHMGNTLLVPTAAYTHISGTRLTSASGDGGDSTVLSFMLKAIPSITSILPWWRLDTAGAGGVTRAVVYDLDPRVVRQEIPLEYTQLAPQPKGLEFIVPTWAMTAGTQIPYPKGIEYIDTV